MTDRPREVAAPRNPWAVASLVCSLIVFCPAVTLVAPILGLRALWTISRRPEQRGRGMAIAGILIGLAVTAAWLIGFAAWWAPNRQVMLEGPRAAIEAGMAGDLDAFRDRFVGPGATAGDAEARAFLDELARRYGLIISSEQADPEEIANALGVDPPRFTGVPDVAPVWYVFRFQRRDVLMLAELVFVDDAGRRLRPPRWGYIAIYDASAGHLVYPEARRADALQPFVAAPGPGP